VFIVYINASNGRNHAFEEVQGKLLKEKGNQQSALKGAFEISRNKDSRPLKVF